MSGSSSTTSTRGRCGTSASIAVAFQRADLGRQVGIDFGQRAFDAVPEIGALAPVEHAEAFAALGGFRVGAAGDHDHFERLAAGIEQARADREPVQFGHVDVDDEDVGLAAARLDQQLHAVGRGLHLETHLHAAVGEQPHDGGIVVGDQHLGHLVARLENVRHVPLSTSFSSVTRPRSQASSASRLASTVPGAPRPARRAMMASSSEAAVVLTARKSNTPAAPASLCTNDWNSSGTKEESAPLRSSVAEASRASPHRRAGAGRNCSRPDASLMDSMWRRTVSASLTG